MIEELNGDFLQKLRGFYYVAKTGSVRKAAEIMRRNPSTISYQIRSLEEELGTVLFDRYKKTVRITEEGRNLLKWTISAFETLQAMRSAICNVKGSLKGRIRIAATLPIASMAVAPLSDFLRDNPEIELEMERCLARDVRKAVEESTVDFGLLPVIARPEEDFMDTLAEARHVLVFHKSNPWNVPQFPSWSDLEKLPYVAFKHTHDMDDLGQYMKAVLNKDFIYRNAVIKLNNYHLISRFVWQKLGVAIMDEMCLEATLFGANWTDLASIPLNHLLPNQIYGLVTRKKRFLSPQALVCMDVLRKFFSSQTSRNQVLLWKKARQEKDSTD